MTPRVYYSHCFCSTPPSKLFLKLQFGRIVSENLPYQFPVQFVWNIPFIFVGKGTLGLETSPILISSQIYISQCYPKKSETQCFIWAYTGCSHKPLRTVYHVFVILQQRVDLINCINAFIEAVSH